MKHIKIFEAWDENAYPIGKLTTDKLKKAFFPEDEVNTPKEPQMSLEDWKALIQGLIALPGDLGVDLGSNDLARAVEAMPEIKTNTDYKKELVKFTEMSKTRLGLDENESSIGMTPTRNPLRNEMNQIKELPAYRDLLAMGFFDVSTPQGLAQGNMRFAPSVPDLNSTIRINLNGSVWRDWPSGKTVRIDKLDPITTIEDYGDRISMVPDFVRG